MDCHDRTKLHSAPAAPLLRSSCSVYGATCLVPAWNAWWATLPALNAQLQNTGGLHITFCGNVFCLFTL